MKNRKYYEQLYTEYPTVVTLIQFARCLEELAILRPES